MRPGGRTTSIWLPYPIDESISELANALGVSRANVFLRALRIGLRSLWAKAHEESKAHDDTRQACDGE